MLIIGYKYESALGKEIQKAVICKDETEYRKMKDKIEENGLDVLEFSQLLKAKDILKH